MRSCPAALPAPPNWRRPSAPPTPSLYRIAGQDYCHHHIMKAAVAAGVIAEVKPGAGRALWSSLDRVRPAPLALTRCTPSRCTSPSSPSVFGLMDIKTSILCERLRWLKRQSTFYGLLIAPVLPRCGLPPQSSLIRNATVQALAGHHPDFNLGHIQPTAMLGRVVNLQSTSRACTASPDRTTATTTS